MAMKRMSKPDECRSIAAEYRMLAKQIADPERKIECQVLAGRWLRLALKLDKQAEECDNVIPFRRKA